jgi:hypothetical protein
MGAPITDRTNSLQRCHWLLLSDSLSDAEQLTRRLLAPEGIYEQSRVNRIYIIIDREFWRQLCHCFLATALPLCSLGFTLIPYMLLSGSLVYFTFSCFHCISLHYLLKFPFFSVFLSHFFFLIFLSISPFL